MEMPKIIAQVTETIEEIEEEQPLEIVQEKQYIVPEQVFSNVQQPAPIVKKVRKKRTMTPEMLEKLAVARAKANEKRKANKEARLKGEMKTPTQVKQEQKEIQEEKKRPVVNNVTNEYKTINNNITQEDIQKIALETSAKATAQALYEYEKIRKERKEEKKIKKEQEAKLQERQNTIKKSIIGGYAGDYKSNKKSIYG
tara:strand:- start:951 stop:1544 length:594 start_codon:yes stop_codon:yes gene_type:complete